MCSKLKKIYNDNSFIFFKLRALIGKPSFIKMLGMEPQRFGDGVYSHMFRFVWLWEGWGPKLKNPKLELVYVGANNRKGLWRDRGQKWRFCGSILVPWDSQTYKTVCCYNQNLFRVGWTHNCKNLKINSGTSEFQQIIQLWHSMLGKVCTNPNGIWEHPGIPKCAQNKKKNL